MTAQITHVRFHGYRKNEDIAIYKWRLDTGEQGESDRASIRSLARETVAVSAGRVLGYRRLGRLDSVR